MTGPHAGTARVVRPATVGNGYAGSAMTDPVLQVGAGLKRPEPDVQPRLARMAPLEVTLPDGTRRSLGCTTMFEFDWTSPVTRRLPVEPVSCGFVTEIPNGS